jgi:penicillin-binding protein 2
MSYHPNEVARRGRFASFALIAVFLVLLGRFFSAQVLRHTEYALQSERNRLNEVPIPAPRGIIYDRNGEVIAENVPGYSVSILAPRSDSLRAMLDRLGERIELTRVQYFAALRRHGQAPNRPAVVLPDAPLDVVAVLEEHRVEFPGLIIQASPKRHYPDSGAVSAFVGYTNEVNEAELESERWVGYKAGHQIGKAGLELQYETELRGAEGSRYVEVDARGRVVRNAGVRAELAAVAGPPLHTNIDMPLQRYIANELFADSLVGAAVAIDPRSGAVLALHSNPSFDPNEFIRGVSDRYYKSLLDDPRRPLYNKAVQGYYEPGSTWKLATAIIALEHGLVRPDEYMPVRCTGSLRMGNRVWRCWDRAGHGSLDLAGAIAKSCDVYFYQLGQRMRLDTLIAGGRRMLFGARTGIDLPVETASQFPTEPVTAYMNRKYGPRGWTSEAVRMNMAIGQGENTQTVINMARFYTALANGGEATRPEIVKRQPERTRIFQVSDAQVALLRHAMSEVVTARGTAGGSAIRDVVFAGKTGTSQNAQNPNADHAWFVGFAPADRPTIVVAVMIEFGLHGSRAARIASKIVERYLHATVVLPPTTGD